jgi:hypothetical protein
LKTNLGNIAGPSLKKKRERERERKRKKEGRKEGKKERKRKKRAHTGAQGVNPLPLRKVPAGP